MPGTKVFNLQVENDLGIVVFEVVNEPMNTWNRDAIQSFLEVIEKLRSLEKDGKIKGAIFISGKPHTFLAGADLRIIEQLESREQLEKDLASQHDCFNRLGKLVIPTLAAINGHCLGAGLEFALACTARIAKESKTTILGLPETQVGLFPAGGGTQRLTRLIGYPAIELILTAKTITAKEAFEAGIVDKYIDTESDLLGEGKQFIREIIEGRRKLNRPAHDFSQIDTVMAEARKNALKKSRGRELPGPTMAMKAIQEGMKVSLSEGLELEKKYFIDVALSKEAKGSINTFFLNSMSDKPQKLMSKGFQPRLIKKVGVIGFGTMGRGVAIDIIWKMMIPVIVKDMPQALEPGKAFIRKILTGMAGKKRLAVPVDDLMKLVTVTSEHTEEFKDVDIVIEAAFEDMNVKKQIFKDLSKEVSNDCIVVSNTSFLSITELAKSFIRPEKFAGLHFFSPIWLMGLVEVVRGEKTSQATIDNLINFAASIKKRPLVCKDNHGFVVNAVLNPFMTNGLKYLEEGNAIEKIDRAFIKFGMPIGPIRLNDEVGIDVSYHIFKELNVEQKTIEALYKKGRYGLKKSGKGFFLADGSVDPEVLPLITIGEIRERSEEEMQMDVLEDMVKISKELLDKHIVDDPRMIDLGLIWGAGYPADKGGPLKWADLTGLSEKLFGKKFYA